MSVILQYQNSNGKFSLIMICKTEIKIEILKYYKFGYPKAFAHCHSNRIIFIDPLN
jgi:hypothetical protein